MKLEELKTRIMSGQQQYYHREQLIELLNKLDTPKQPEKKNVLTLF